MEEAVQLPQIFEMEVVQAGILVNNCKSALDKWESGYMATREKIEESGTDHRWEFDRQKLFKKTKYMSRICTDLFEILKVLDQFYKFLGPELAEVTGDTDGIDELLEQVAGLVAGFKSFGSSKKMFDDRAASQWGAMVQVFREHVEMIEQRAIHFLDHSFQNLRSAEGAFQLLQNFKNIESRDVINEKMGEKFADILKQYGTEVHRMSTVFHNEKGSFVPPKNTPLVAGKISWARGIFDRVKKPVLSFKSMPHLLQTPEGQVACRDYVQLGKEILEYEQDLYKNWSQNVVDVAQDALTQPILVKRGGVRITNIVSTLTVSFIL